MKLISNNLKFLRKQLNLSTHALANTLGLSEKKIIQTETEPGTTHLSLLLLLSSFYKMPLHALLQVDLSKRSKKASGVKLVVMDIDGVLTDGGMYYTEKGDEFKKFDSKDGLAIKRLVVGGMQLAFLSNGKNVKIIQSRAKLLGVQRVYVGSEEKLIVLAKWMNELKLNYKQVAYIGDDLNDLQVIKKVGFTACPANSVDTIKQEVDIILSRNGGDACVREWLDLYF